MKKPVGIIFDCDGCLLDSEKIYLDTVKIYLKAFNIEADYEDLVFVLGKPMPKIASGLIEKFKLDTSIDELIVEQRKLFNDSFKNAKLVPMPFLKEFLKDCKENNITLAIASSSKKDYINDVLKRLDIEEYFDFITSGEEVQNGKPSPDIYLLTAKKMNIGTDDLMIIEDSESGIHSGVSAGIYTIGYKGSIIEQDTSEANISVKSYKEIEWSK